jgi:hypothetical protein
VGVGSPYLEGIQWDCLSGCLWGPRPETSSGRLWFGSKEGRVAVAVMADFDF